MASTVFTSLSSLIQTVQSLKLKNTGEVETEVESIHRALELINVFVESKRNEGGTKEIARQMRDLTFEAEDAIRTFIIEVEEHKRRSLGGKLIHVAGHFSKLQSLASKLESIQTEILKILENSTKFDINQNVEPSGDARAAAELQRRRREVAEKNDVEGFVDDTTTLVTQLTKSEGNPKLNVVSIIGMGGLGKTTLAKNIYNDERIKRHFDCYVWLYVSQDFGTTKFTLEIDQALEDMGAEQLKEKLVKDLQGKKYLVVLDDVWKIEVWNEVKTAFPDDLNGSRILITSRIKKVAAYASRTSHPYHLPFLNEDDSWKLLSKKMFRGEECPGQWETLVRKIAKRCHGLPLSIVELGNYLAEEEKITNLTLERYVEGNVNSYLDGCKNIMALSFTDLPQPLRPCFLYFGVFPEKFEISKRQLIQLWIAENFISQPSNRDYLELEAEKTLDDLISRSLVLVASRRTNGGVKTCHIHDLLRRFCISGCKEDEFLEVIRDGKLSLLNKSRRLSIQHRIDPRLSSNPSRRPRSLFFLGGDTYGFDPDLCKWVLEHFKYLRVLSFWRVNLYSIPTKIENLIMLKYLRIESPNLIDIPASICNLIYLETLDMKGTSLQRLPKGISKLRSLRNLYVSGPVKLSDDWDLNFEGLWNLQVLSTVSLDARAVRPIVDAKLPKVRKLGIWFASDKSDSEVVDVLKGLQKLQNLKILKIINYQERPLPNVFPSTITKITLRQVCLQDGGSMRELGELPNLSILKIQHCSLSSVVLKVAAGSFLRLECLILENLPIIGWEQGKGAMPCLNRLVIKELFELTKLPSTFSITLPHGVVEVVRSNLELVKTLEELKKNRGFKLEVDPPIDDDFYRTTAVPPVTSSREPPSWIKWIQRFMENILLCCGTHSRDNTSLQDPSS